MAVFKRIGGEVKNMGSSFVRRFGENLKKVAKKSTKRFPDLRYNKLIYHSFRLKER